jgi:hypothetical protein
MFDPLSSPSGKIHPTQKHPALLRTLLVTTYRFAGDCQVPANTCKTEQSWAGIMG